MDKGVEQFVYEVKENMKRSLPEDMQEADVSLHTFRSNNGMEKTALAVLKPGRITAPNIYLDHFYNLYRDGADMDRIMEKIAEMRMENELDSDPDTAFITDFEQCRDKVMPCLVGVEGNDGMLEDRPHVTIEDLAVVFCIDLGDTKLGNASIPVQNHMLQLWGVDADELYSIAVRNLEAADMGVFCSLNKLMADMMKDSGGENPEMEELLPENDFMYVLTNKANVRGAAMVLDHKIMERIVEKIGEPIILPSSIHEVIVLPDTQKSDNEKWKHLTKAALEEMVQEVNETQVSLEDRLSNSIYRYTLKNGIVRL